MGRVRGVLQRVALLSLGIAAGLALLELGLRAARLWVVPRAQVNVSGRGGESRDDEVRVLCIGESTTYGGWPEVLESILNERCRSTHFRVFNKGIVGAQTTHIAAKLDSWLDEYNPQVVISMLGINDEGNVLVDHRVIEPPVSGRGLLSMKLLRLLWRGARARHGEGTADERTFFEIDPTGTLDGDTAAVMSDLDQRRGELVQTFRYDELLEVLARMVVLDPRTPVYYLAYMSQVIEWHENRAGLDRFCRVVCGNESGDLDDTTMLTLLLEYQRKHPQRFTSYRELTSYHKLAGDTSDEERALLPAFSQPGIAGYAWMRRAARCREKGMPEVELSCLKTARGLLPRDWVSSMLLGQAYSAGGFYRQAATMYEQAIALRGDRPMGLADIEHRRAGMAYLLAGDRDKAEEHFTMDEQLHLGRVLEVTRSNYHQVVASVRSRNIELIAMQYPTLKVEVLKRLLDYRDDIHYCDNEAVFKKALTVTPYRVLFWDEFAGSFGHLTDRGNRILAENVATTVLEVIGARENRR